jgi:quinoprotein glucose dehydrogenase
MRSVYAFILAICAAGPAFAADWPHYGGDLGGQRYSSSSQITPATVRDLVQVWEYRTGDLASRPKALFRRMKFQVTPILYDDKLFVCTPFNEIIALDPGTGEQKWRFDPKVPLDMKPANAFNCRGVTVWDDLNAAPESACRVRIFSGTNDGRLISVDARTGLACAGFGENGQVTLDPGKPLLWKGEFQVTSAPVAINDTIVVGSAISDNARVDAPHGTVRAYDARTGALKWTWDPIPRTPEAAAAQGWKDGWQTAGHATW